MFKTWSARDYVTQFVSPSNIYSQGYVLQFDTPAGREQNRWHGAAATIEKKDGHYVMGCVWEIDEDHIDRLDAWVPYCLLSVTDQH